MTPCGIPGRSSRGRSMTRSTGVSSPPTPTCCRLSRYYWPCCGGWASTPASWVAVASSRRSPKRWSDSWRISSGSSATDGICPPPKTPVERLTSADLLGDRVQCMQYVNREFTRGGVVKLRGRPQCLLDEFHARFIGRAECCFGNHVSFLVSRVCWLKGTRSTLQTLLPRRPGT